MQEQLEKHVSFTVNSINNSYCVQIKASIFKLRITIYRCVPCAPAHNPYVVSIDVTHNHVTDEFVSRITQFLYSFLDLFAYFNGDISAEDWVVFLFSQVCFQNVLNDWHDSVFLCEAKRHRCIKNLADWMF